MTDTNTSDPVPDGQSSADATALYEIGKQYVPPLYDKFIKILGRSGIKTYAKKLGRWKDGGLIGDEEQELTAVSDYAAFHHRTIQGSLAEQVRRQLKPEPGSVQDELLTGIENAVFCIFSIIDWQPDGSVTIHDMLRDQEMVVADPPLVELLRELDQEGEDPPVIAGHMIPFRGLYLSSGSLLPLSEEAIDNVMGRLEQRFPSGDFASLSKGNLAEMVAIVVKLALEDLEGEAEDE